jgi:hypothetical protein
MDEKDIYEPPLDLTPWPEIGSQSPLEVKILRLSIKFVLFTFMLN